MPPSSAGRRRLPLLRELGAFGVVGGVCFVVDLTLFQLLYAVVGAGAVTSKLVASLVATTLAFLGHRSWSFARRRRTGLRRQYSLFLLINGGTLLLSLGIVAFVRYPLGQESPLVLQAANVAAIAVGTALRWLTYRLWVFPARTTPVAGERALAPASGQL
ncbi:putative flippase GtrA [Blastococcus saxobsidens]|uniref:Putative flippase GtrA n=2 Tax=Blastococcus saxobsidens TaxID=138336 RepID=A0A4Q7YAE4_9ACTN|nr:putative flippase GtrA [Blastococcus saxobsidens]